MVTKQDDVSVRNKGGRTGVVSLLTEACKLKLEVIPKAGEDDILKFAQVTDYDLKGNERMIYKVSMYPRGTIDRACMYSVGWVMDGVSDFCMRCDTPFGTLLKRKHHCRICGYLICNECCSPKKIEIPALAGCEKVSRVCKTICLDLLPEEIAQSTSYEMDSRPSMIAKDTAEDASAAAATAEQEKEGAKSIPDSPIKSSLLSSAEERQRAELEIDLAEEMSHIRSRLERGMLVIKHGRSGEPKRRLLKCDHEVTKFFFVNANTAASAKSNTTNKTATNPSLDTSKIVHIADILSLRLGTDLDPTSMADASTRPKGTSSSFSSSNTSDSGSGGTVSSGPKKRRMRLFRAFSRDTDRGQEMYGTATLRRTLTSTDKLAKCLSLITEQRSFDIECLQGGDFDFLAWHLSRLHELSSKIRDL